MNQLHQLAIELKYEGKVYEEISQALNNKLTAGTLKKYFSEGGLLQVPYLEYQELQTKLRHKEARNLFKSHVSKAAKVITDTLDNAIHNGDNKLAVQAAEKVLDRAGFIIPTKIDSETTDARDPKDMTQEELHAYVKETTVGRGKDPVTGEEISRLAGLTVEERDEYILKRTKWLWKEYGVFESEAAKNPFPHHICEVLLHFFEDNGGVKA
jgi:hypothetical protein